eukprot:jgi/Ulvmu1/2613/UM014_0064.1
MANDCKRDTRRETGRVKLNGKVASPGDRVQPGDTVTLDGKPIKWTTHNEPTSKATSKEHVYIKYWKPKGIVCTTDRTIKGNVIDQIKHPKRVFMVGRLDKDTTGLLLLTDDGRLVNALLRSQHAHYKTYLVRVDRPLRVAALRNMRKGVTITTYAQRDGKSKALTAPTLPATVEQVDMQTFMITITEGRNRQIRKMCEAVGYKVIGLHREAVAGITLKGMKLGAWEEVARADRRIIERVLASADQLIK